MNWQYLNKTGLKYIYLLDYNEFDLTNLYLTEHELNLKSFSLTL